MVKTSWEPQKAHPRERGENITLIFMSISHGGSPPRTRGKLRLPALAPLAHWLTPANAGKTLLPAADSCHQRAHPRERGENLLMPSTIELYVGSPPRTRGKLLSAEGGKGGARLTPANAGKTWEAYAQQPPEQAHPRERGENNRYQVASQCIAGSPPRTRGKLDIACPPCPAAGLTPANAGKTRILLKIVKKARAHPRERGENWFHSFRPFYS